MRHQSLPPIAALVGGVVVAIAGCGDDLPDPGESDLEAEYRSILKIPEYLEVPSIPDFNPPTPEKIALGRRLFYDTRLSGNQTQSCASCHEQRLAFADGKKTPIGSTGHALKRNSLGLANAVYHSTLTWANNGLLVLEDQLQVPIRSDNPVELGVSDGNVDEVMARFQRGDRDALTAQQRRGLALFNGERLECFHCHNGVNLTSSYRDFHTTPGTVRYPFFNNGLYNVDGEGSYPPHDQGLYELTLNPNDRGRFRPQSLRNVAVTAPYMHDGSIETLEDVVRHYAAGGRNIESGPFAGDGRTSPLKSGLVRGFSITEEELADVVAFLESLTDQGFLANPALSDPFAAVAP